MRRNSPQYAARRCLAQGGSRNSLYSALDLPSGDGRLGDAEMQHRQLARRVTDVHQQRGSRRQCLEPRMLAAVDLH